MSKSMFSALSKYNPRFDGDELPTTTTDVSVHVESEVAENEEAIVEAEEASEEVAEVMEEGEEMMEWISTLQHQQDVIKTHGMSSGMFALIDKDKQFSKMLNKTSRVSISAESIDRHASHDQNTKIALEGLKDVAIKVWERIKEFFKSIPKLVQTMISKIMGVFQNKQKRIDELIKLVEQYKNVSVTLDPPVEVYRTSVDDELMIDIGNGIKSFIHNSKNAGDPKDFKDTHWLPLFGIVMDPATGAFSKDSTNTPFDKIATVKYCKGNDLLTLINSINGSLQEIKKNEKTEQHLVKTSKEAEADINKILKSDGNDKELEQKARNKQIVIKNILLGIRIISIYLNRSINDIMKLTTAFIAAAKEQDKK